MEPVAHLYKNLTRIQKMRAAEGKAVVQQNPPIGNIRRIQRNGKSFAKVLAKSQVECGVAREMPRRGIAVRKSRRVIDIGRRIAVPRKAQRAAEMQGIALVVIEQEESARRREIGQSAANRSEAFGGAHVTAKE